MRTTRRSSKPVRRRNASNPTEAQARAAVNLLIRYGRMGWDVRVPDGQAFGSAVAPIIGNDEVARAAMAMLEDWNGHLSVAAIDAIEHGNGKVKRVGRELKITLPAHWSRM